MQDLITVYIPTHNRSDLLMRAIESVRNQTYKNIEI
ncbi:glycosyltransferase family 2 protein, partial [Klebsiella pneumoniae]|nr:glycosyltransferase family 2 protein [Klebsiella pneumoniae]